MLDGCGEGFDPQLGADGAETLRLDRGLVSSDCICGNVLTDLLIDLVIVRITQHDVRDCFHSREQRGEKGTDVAESCDHQRNAVAR